MEETREQINDLLLLRREYGIGAVEAFTRLPSWEYDLLVVAARPPGDEQASVDVGPAADPWLTAPDL